MERKKKPTQIIVRTPISPFFLFFVSIVCLDQICPPVYGGANHHLFYGVAPIYGNFGMI